MSAFLPHLRTGWHVDQAILSEEERLVIIRFGDELHPDVMRMDETLFKIAERIRNFAVVYITDVHDFDELYELYDDVTVMFFWRNKHMMCDFGTGDNNKLNFPVDDPQDMIDVVETIFRGARKGKGLVISPVDFKDEKVKTNV